MSTDSDVDAQVVNFPCPIGKERCSGPIVTREGDKTFLICRQVEERKFALPEVIEKCGDELPALLFMSFMALGRNK